MTDERILVVRERLLGDVIHSIPAIRGLRAAFPAARIDYLVEDRFADLLAEEPSIDGLVVAERGAGWRSRLALVSRLRANRYTTVLDLHGTPKSAALAWLTGARTRIGFRFVTRSFLYTRAVVPAPLFTRHSVDSQWDVVAAFGVPGLPGRARIVSGGASGAATAFLEAAGLAGGRFAVVHASPSNRFKRWTERGFRTVLRALLRAGCPPVLIGSAGDARELERLRDAASPEVRIAPGTLSLRALREVIARAAVYVGADSGPLHLAATTDTPIVGLFGPTEPGTFGPYGAASVAIAREVGCRPCTQKVCIRGDFACLSELPPEPVVRAALELAAARCKGVMHHAPAVERTSSGVRS